MRGRRYVIVALALALAGGGCDLYIRNDDVDAQFFNDGGRPPDAVPLDGPRDGAGFPQLPAGPARAHQRLPDGTWIDLGEADWTCLGVPRDATLAAPLSLSGRTIDWETGAPVGDQIITALPSREMAPPLGEVTSGGGKDDTGEFAATFSALPPGRTRYGFRIRPAVPQLTTTFVIEQYFLPGAAHVRDLAVVSPATAATLPTWVGQVRDPDQAMVIGDVVDCQMRPVSNMIVVLSNSLTMVEPTGVDVWAFETGVPAALNAPTRADGRFAILQMPPGMSFALQAWGFRNVQEHVNGAMQRLATVTINQPGESVTTLKVEPRQSDP